MEPLYLLVALPLGIFGLRHLMRDFRRVWANRGARTALARLELSRVIAVLVAFSSILVVLPAAAFGAELVVLVCVALVFAGFALFLVLSLVVGFIEGYARGNRWKER